MFIYKKKDIEIDSESLEKLYKENSYRSFFGIRFDEEYNEFFYEDGLKFANKEELGEFFSKETIVAGQFSYAQSNCDKDIVEYSDNKYFYCKELEVIKPESNFSNIVNFLKNKIFKGVDSEKAFNLIKSYVEEFSKKVAFFADNKEITFFNDTEKLLLEHKGILYDNLDFLKEKSVFHQGYTPVRNQNVASATNATSGGNMIRAKVISKYSLEVKTRIVELLLKQMVALPAKDTKKSRDAIKTYLNTLNDERFDTLLNFYKIRAVS